MNVQAHPNLHAVQFTIALVEPILQDRRIPTKAEIISAYRASRRGPAKDIDIDTLADRFMIVVGDRWQVGDVQGTLHLVERFVVHISCLLDGERDGDSVQDQR